MKIVDEARYVSDLEKNRDPYGARIFSYAEEWANMLESDITAHPELAVPEVIAKFAGKRSHDADTDGITGFMYGAAVQVLAQYWEHGEALRRWLNKETQVGDEGDRANESGGVLNPALLDIDL